MCLKGGEVDNNNNQHKTKRMSHHLLHKKPMRKQRRLNRCNTIDKIRGKWISEAWEEAMDAIEGEIASLRKANKHWNIPFISLSNHLYGETTFLKTWASRCANIGRRSSDGCLGFGNARSWTIN
jgi:hypothetical protein